MNRIFQYDAYREHRTQESKNQKIRLHYSVQQQRPSVDVPMNPNRNSPNVPYDEN